MNESAVLRIQTCIQTDSYTYRYSASVSPSLHLIRFQGSRNEILYAKLLLAAGVRPWRGLWHVCPPLHWAQGAGGVPRGQALGGCVFYLFLLRHKLQTAGPVPGLSLGLVRAGLLPARSPHIAGSVNLSFVHVKSYISSFLPRPPPFLPSPTATALVSSAPSCFQLEAPPADPAG